MSSCDNCKFTEWCKDKADDVLWCVQKSERNIAYRQGREDAIDECLVIVKFHANSYDGIFWAIRELEKLKENENEVEE